MMLITFLSVLLQVATPPTLGLQQADIIATPPTFTPKYDLYPIDATLADIGMRNPRKAPTKSHIYYKDGEWYSASGEWTEQERNEWEKWYHHYDFLHWTKKAFWFVFTPKEYQAYQEWLAQKAAWDATHDYANGERPYNSLPIGDALVPILTFCGIYVCLKAQKHKIASE